MVERIPTGSIVGMVIGALVIGILLGRSSKFMRGMAKAHVAAHSRGGDGGSAEQHNDQRVTTVVVVDRDGVPLTDGRYDLGSITDDHRSASSVVAGTPGRRSLAPADDLWSEEFDVERIVSNAEAARGVK